MTVEVRAILSALEKKVSFYVPDSTLNKTLRFSISEILGAFGCGEWAGALCALLVFGG